MATMIPDLDIAQAAALLRTGGVVAYPTEAVWGLGCDPFDQAAVQRLLALKQRPGHKGLILLAASWDLLEPLLEPWRLPRDRLAQVLESWPGPHTWLMPCVPAIPEWLRGAHPTLAVRGSAPPQGAALCSAVGGPHGAPRAHARGAPPPRHRHDLDPALLAGTDGVVVGDTGSLQTPTPIRDAATGDLIRT